jgi:hypothetical protein
MQELQTIDPTALAQVSGGASSSSSSTSTSNDQILTALTGILDSIKALGQPNNNAGGLNPQEMFMLMMIMQQQRSAPIAVAAPDPWSQQPVIRYY